VRGAARKGSPYRDHRGQFVSKRAARRYDRPRYRLSSSAITDIVFRASLCSDAAPGSLSLSRYSGDRHELLCGLGASPPDLSTAVKRTFGRRSSGLPRVTYAADRYTTHDPASGRWYNDPRWDGSPYTVKGFNVRNGQTTLPFDGKASAGSLEKAWPDSTIWPREFQHQGVFLRKGHIVK